MQFVSQALKSDTKWTDVNLFLADGEMTTHACLLSAISPVLKAALEGDFKESSTRTSSGGKRSVQLMTITLEAMQRTLDFCFNPAFASVLEDLSCQEAIDTLAASHYLQIPLLSNKCANILIAGMTVENCGDMVRVAESFEQATLGSVALNMHNIAKNQGHAMTSLLIDQRKAKQEQKKCRESIELAEEALRVSIAKSADISERIGIEEQRIFEAGQKVLVAQRKECSKSDNSPAIHFPSTTATLVVLPHEEGDYQVITDARDSDDPEVNYYILEIPHPRHHDQFDDNDEYLQAMRDPDDGCVFVDSLGRYANLFDALRCAKPGDSIKLLSGIHCVDVEIGLLISKQVHIFGEREIEKEKETNSSSSASSSSSLQQPRLIFGQINDYGGYGYEEHSYLWDRENLNYIVANAHLHLDNIDISSRVCGNKFKDMLAINLGQGVNLWMENCSVNMSCKKKKENSSWTIRHLVDVKEKSSVWLENSILNGSCSSAISINPQAKSCHITGCHIHNCGVMDHLPAVHVRLFSADKIGENSGMTFINIWDEINPRQSKYHTYTSLYKTPAVKVMMDGNVIEANHGAGVAFAVYHKIAGWYYQNDDESDYDYHDYREPIPTVWYRPQTIAKYWDEKEFLLITKNNTVRGNNMSVPSQERETDGSFYTIDANYDVMELSTFVSEDRLATEIKTADKHCYMYECDHIANGDGIGKILLIKHISIDNIYKEIQQVVPNEPTDDLNENEKKKQKTSK